MDKSTKRMNTVTIIAIVAVIVIAAGVAGYFVNKKYFKNTSSGERQAVFLTNGQVYFGYISEKNDQYIQLKDIYYLKTTTDLQTTTGTTPAKVSLIKLGSELHGPEDQMFINRDQILFFENMKGSSKIADAISKFSSQSQ